MHSQHIHTAHNIQNTYTERERERSDSHIVYDSPPDCVETFIECSNGCLHYESVIDYTVDQVTDVWLMCCY